jgi:hypothetical protein
MGSSHTSHHTTHTHTHAYAHTPLLAPPPRAAESTSRWSALPLHAPGAAASCPALPCSWPWGQRQGGFGKERQALVLVWSEWNGMTPRRAPCFACLGVEGGEVGERAG